MELKQTHGFVLLMSVFFVFARSDTTPTVVTKAGTVIGVRSTLNVAGKELQLDSFLGIPYAKPPVANLRFAKPELLENFDRHEATKFGAACPQIVTPPMPQPEVMSEDCLSLNIFVPSEKPAESTGRAVMVFIHGGGFATGSSDLYIGNTLAVHGDVIVVTINYRVGLFGFFSTGDEYAPGNLALWDQRLALQWVNQHIASFGGDKQRVTIFGQSAGSMGVFLQALYPPNKGLFQRVIAESGTPSSVYGSYVHDAMVSAKILADDMNCSADTSKVMVECLRQSSYETLMAVVLDIMSDMEKLIKLKYFPVMDNDFIKVDLKDMIALAATKDLPEIEFYRSLDVLTGFNAVEGVIYGYMAAENLDEFRPTREDMKNKMSATFDILLLGHKFPDVVVDMIMSEYTDWSDPNNPEAIRKQFLKVFGDPIMAIGSIEYLRVHTNTSADVNSYLYHFRPVPSNTLLPSPSWVEGANHGDELGLVFGLDPTFLEESARTFQTKYAPPKDWEYRLSALIMDYWTNFAKTGNPNLPVTVEPEWPRYKLESESYLELNAEKHYVKQFLCARETNFWRNIVPAVEDAIQHRHDASSPFSKKVDSTCSANGDCDEG